MTRNICIKESQVLDFPYEKLLWENPSPTANFSVQDIPLIQSVYNFDKVRIYWKVSTTIDTESYTDIEKSQFNLIASGNSTVKLWIGGTNASGTHYYRIAYINEDSVHFGTGKQYNTTTTAEAYCIPTKITGIKKIEVPIPSRGDETITVLWVNPTPNAAMASGASITLSDGLENYDFIRVLWKASTSDVVNVNSWADWYIGKDPARLQTTNGNESLALCARSDGTTPYIRTMALQSTSAPFTSFTVGNGSRIANTTSNTSYVIPLIICGVNYEETTHSRISNEFVVSSTEWSQDTVVFGDEDCYYNDIDIIQFDGKSPIIYIISDQSKISYNEQIAYTQWTFATVNTETMKLRLYSPAIPSSNFMIKVEGVR